MGGNTSLFDVNVVKEKMIASTLREVSDILRERGYNPTNQIVGYLISGDPGYISNYKDCRSKILEFDRSEMVAVIFEDYIK